MILDKRLVQLDRRTKTLLVFAGMITVLFIVATVISFLLYRHNLSQHRYRLIGVARSQAELIKAVASFDAQYSANDFTLDGGAREATLSQIREANKNIHAVGKTDEWVLGERQGDMIVFLIGTEQLGHEIPLPVPYESDLAEPMRRALDGESGIMIGRDYLGQQVLAAYEAIPVLKVGLIAKMHMSEIRQPFVRIQLGTIGITVAVLLIGALVFLRISQGLVTRLEESEASQQATYKRHLLYVERSPMAAIEIAPDLEVISWNPAAERIFGYTVQEALGQSIIDLIIPDEAQAEVDKVWQALITATGGQYNVNRSKTKDGRIILCEWYNTPIVDVQGAVASVIAQAVDITEREAAKQALGQFKDTLDATLDCVFMFGPEPWRFIYVNQGAKDQVGYTEEELLQMTPVDIKPEFDQDKFREAVAPLVNGEQTALQLETVHQHKDGHQIPVDIFIQYIETTGDEGRFIAIVRDISERRVAREALIASGARLAEAQRIARLGYWDWNIVTNELDWSDEIYRIFGWEPQEFPATYEAFQETIYPADREKVASAVESALEGAPYRIDHRITLPTGVVRYVHEQGEVTSDADGKPVRMVGTVQDVTETREAQEKLNAYANKLEWQNLIMTKAVEEAEAATIAKSEFLANMSHELRTPLNSVIGFAKILQKNTNRNLVETELTYLERIFDNGTHLLRLINDILDISKIETGKMEVIAETLSLPELIQDTLQQLGSQARSKEIVVTAEIPSEVKTIETDQGKLKQMLINLVGNALKFTAEGKITIALQTDSTSHQPVRIDVTDTGIGIPQDRLHDIFKSFQQADSSTARKYGGTGLGLAITQRLSELLGFGLEVSSKEGEGTSFGIILSQRGHHLKPKGSDETWTAYRVVNCVEKRRTAEALTGQFDGALALVISDIPEASQKVSQQLEDVGLSTLVATSGGDGLEMARQYHPDLITLDFTAPEDNCWQIYRELSADPILNKIPIVVLSDDAGSCRARLPDHIQVLEKPVDDRQYSQVLRDILGAKSITALVVDDDPIERKVITEICERRNVKVVMAGDGHEALELLPEVSPDVIILDLMMPGLDGTATVQKIRENPAFTHIPVIIATMKDLTPEEESFLSRFATTILVKGPQLHESLERTLTSLVEAPTAT